MKPDNDVRPIDAEFVLDHGYVQLIETWGSDERIIEAARMSTGKGFNGWGPMTRCTLCDAEGVRGIDTAYVAHAYLTPNQMRCDHRWETKPGDEKLLRYLYEHKHATPFEMAGMIIEVQAPIFVFREWHRHRTQSYNEMSARYAPLPDLNYIPSMERLMRGASLTGNKQASGMAGTNLKESAAENFRTALTIQYQKAEFLYQEALTAGVPKELARSILPVGRYSRMRASANLRNWLAFLTLRMAPEAQWEIQRYADVVGGFIAEKFPRTWALFIQRAD